MTVRMSSVEMVEPVGMVSTPTPVSVLMDLQEMTAAQVRGIWQGDNGNMLRSTGL